MVGSQKSSFTRCIEVAAIVIKVNILTGLFLDSFFHSSLYRQLIGVANFAAEIFLSPLQICLMAIIWYYNGKIINHLDSENIFLILIFINSMLKGDFNAISTKK